MAWIFTEWNLPSCQFVKNRWVALQFSRHEVGDTMDFHTPIGVRHTEAGKIVKLFLNSANSLNMFRTNLRNYCILIRRDENYLKIEAVLFQGTEVLPPPPNKYEA